MQQSRAQPVKSLVRYFLTILGFFLLAQLASGAEYFVAPDGNDASPGTKAAPFASLNRAEKQVRPGDTVWIKGGTYRMSEQQIAQSNGLFARVIVMDKSGEKEAPIQYLAQPGETPVFDFSNVKPANQRVTAFYVTGSWRVLRGIDVTGVQVTIKEHTGSIGFENQGSNNRFERCNVHDGMALGFACQRGSDNLFLNCDAYRNYDSVSEKGFGGNVDGFGCHTMKLGPGNVFRGCRAWLNSDDGYDCINAGQGVTFENCWAFKNGFSADGQRRADGNGFKLGGYGSTTPDKLPNPIPRHRAIGCLAVENKASGFYANHHVGGLDFINNTAYHNGANFNFLCRKLDNVTDIPGFDHVIRNNLAYKGRDVTNLDDARCKLQTNSWDLKAPLSDADFVSLDVSQLTRPRQDDGSLPAITLMNLKPNSPLLSAGTGDENHDPSRTRRAVAIGCFPADAASKR